MTSTAEPTTNRKGRRLVVAGFLLVATLGRPAEAARPVVVVHNPGTGLPQTQVNDILQDGDGYLWVATESGGIGRWNGHRWETWDVSRGLPSNSVHCLALDPRGRLLVGTLTGWVLFDGTRMIPQQAGHPLARAEIDAFRFLPNGDLLVGTEEGLWRIPASPSTPPSRSLDAAIGKIVPSSDGGWWAAGRGGLWRLDPAGKPAERIEGLPPGSVADIVDRPGRPLLAAISRAGLYDRRDGSWRPVAASERIGSNVVALLVPRTEPDALWIGTEDRGAFLQRGDSSLESFGTNEGLPHPTIRALFEDREGILWLGGEGGLAKRAPSAFLLWDAADGLLAGAAFFGMAEGDDGTIWAASGSGLWKLDLAQRWTRLPLEEHGVTIDVNDVAIDTKGGVWAATTRGLARLVGGKLELLGIPSGTTPTVLNITPLPDGSIAFGTRRQGLGILSPRGTVRMAAPPVGRSIEALALISGGRLLAGGYGWGVAEVDPDDPEKPRLLHSPESLPSPNVNHIFEDRDHRIWISTERGAVGIAPDGSRILVDRKSGLPDDFVYWVGQERSGALWLGTNRGAVRRLATGEVEVYGARDGLPVDECNDDGFLLTRDGRVLVSSVGVARFIGRPKPVAVPLQPIRIERIWVGGQAWPVVSRIDLPPKPGQVRIEMACLSFVDETRNRFRYRLGGLSDDWIESDPGRYEAVFGGLGAGEYLFEALASSSDGRISERPVRLTIVVRPIWWQSNAARLMALFAIIAAAAIFVRLRLRAQERRGAELERLVRERTDELRSANEKLARMAITDDLTGIDNRRRILERLAESLAWARRHGSPLSVLLADLDHFKTVNDTLGHAVGDDVLKAAALALAESLREVDGVGRYGGEEFLVLFPGEEQEGALASAERLRVRVGAALASDPRLAILRNVPTLSGGIASIDPDLADPAELVQRADEALYAAKAAGRDRIMTWPVPKSAASN